MEELTKEEFNELINVDKFIHAMRFPVACLDSNHKFKHYRTCTYPIEYIITPEQIAQATDKYYQRHDDIIDNIKVGDLVFKGMGCDYPARFDGDVCNHRIRCYFKNNDDITYFIEILKCGEHFEKKGYGFSFNFNHVVKEDGEHSYYENVLTRDAIQLPFTKDNVLKVINEKFNASYTNMRVENYFITADEYINTCK